MRERKDGRFVVEVVPSTGEPDPTVIGATDEFADAVGLARKVAAVLPVDREVRVVSRQDPGEPVLWQSFDLEVARDRG